VRPQVKRRERREGARDSHKVTAQRLLNARMRQAAIEHAMGGSGRGKGKGKSASATDAADDAAALGNAVYFDDLENEAGPSSARTSGSLSASPEKGSRKKDWHKDPYALPALEQDLSSVTASTSAAARKSSRGQRTDFRFASEAEIRNVLRHSDIDVDSPEFRMLPSEMQYELVGEMRAASRGTSFARLQAMLAASPTAIDFSKAQVMALKTRNELTQKSFEVSDAIGDANIKVPIRVAGARNREYVLVRNPGTEGGFTLGVRDSGASATQAIDVDAEEPVYSDVESDTHGGELSDEADMEEVEVGPAPRAASPRTAAAIADFARSNDPEARRLAAARIVRARAQQHARERRRELGIRDDGEELEEQLRIARAGQRARDLFRQRGKDAAPWSIPEGDDAAEWEDAALLLDDEDDDEMLDALPVRASVSEDEEEDLSRALELSRADMPDAAAPRAAVSPPSGDESAPIALDNDEPIDDEDMEMDDVEPADFGADLYAQLHASMPVPPPDADEADDDMGDEEGEDDTEPVWMRLAPGAPVPASDRSTSKEPVAAPPLPAPQARRPRGRFEGLVHSSGPRSPAMDAGTRSSGPRATVGGPAIAFRLQDRTGEPERLDPRLFQRRPPSPKPPAQQMAPPPRPSRTPTIVDVTSDDESSTVEMPSAHTQSTSVQPSAASSDRMKELASMLRRGSKRVDKDARPSAATSGSPAERGYSAQESSPQLDVPEASSVTSTPRLETSDDVDRPQLQRKNSLLPPKAPPSDARAMDAAPVVETPLHEPAAASMPEIGDSPSPVVESEMSHLEATEQQAALAAGIGYDDELGDAIASRAGGPRSPDAPVQPPEATSSRPAKRAGLQLDEQFAMDGSEGADAAAAVDPVAASSENGSATIETPPRSAENARESDGARSADSLSAAPESPSSSKRRASDDEEPEQGLRQAAEPVLTANDLLGSEADKLGHEVTLDNISSAVDELPNEAPRSPAADLFRRKDDEESEGEEIEWSPSPSPAPQALGADGFPLPTLEELEALEVQDEEEMGQVAGGDVASFLSRAKGQGLYEAQQEAQAEVDKLRAEAANSKRSEEDITVTMAREIQHMLRCFGIPYLTAPMEAEAQCAELVSRNLVDGIITDDSDVFLFGGTRVYKNMFADKKVVECFLLTDLERELGIDREKLVQLAYLLGSDYTEGLVGVGPVLAMEILSLFSSRDGLLRFRDWWSKVQAGKDTPKDTRGKTMRRIKKTLAEKVFLDASWPDARVVDAYYEPQVDSSDEPFQWGLPDLDAIRTLLNEYLSWTQEKTDQYLLPVIEQQTRRSRARGNQSSLDRSGFFDLTAGTGAFSAREKPQFGSKRLQNVVQAFRETEKSRRTARAAAATSSVSSSKKRQGPQTPQEEVQEDVPEELVGKEMGKRRPIVSREEQRHERARQTLDTERDGSESDNALDRAVEALDGSVGAKAAPKRRKTAARRKVIDTEAASDANEEAERPGARKGASKQKGKAKRKTARQKSGENDAPGEPDAGNSSSSSEEEWRPSARGSAPNTPSKRKRAPAAKRGGPPGSTSAGPARGAAGGRGRGRGRGRGNAGPGATTIAEARTMSLDDVARLPPSRSASSTPGPSNTRPSLPPVAPAPASGPRRAHIEISEDESSD
jgi:5'-3' exonuclease